MHLVEAQNRNFDLDLLFEQFELDQALCAKSIRGFARSEPQRFLEDSLSAFQKRPFSPALHCVGMTLVQDGRLPRRVIDLIDLPREEVIGLVRKLMQCDPLFDFKILEALQNTGGQHPVGNLEIVRALDILDAVSLNLRLIPLIQQMLKDPDPRIQSKAAIFVGRRTQNPCWAQRKVLDADPRVRANVVEILYGMSSPTSNQLMWNMLSDENNRVIGNALLGLHQMGDVAALPHIFRMAERPEHEFRSTAAWVMGSTGDPRFAQALANLLQDPEKPVRKIAFRALQDIKTALSAAYERPGLTISVVGVGQEENVASLTVVVRDSAGNPSKQISPTAWILVDGDKIVRDYSVQALDYQTPLSVAFLSVETSESKDFEFSNALEGIRRCLPLRRLDDRWAILKLKPSSMDSAPAGGFEITPDTVLHLKHVQKSSGQDTVKIPACFSRSLPDILSMLAAGALNAGNNAAEAIRNGSVEVLESRELAGEKQHLICLGPAGLEGLLESMTLRAPDSRVVVHAITLPRNSRERELRALVESTGGYFVVASEASTIPQLCEVLYTALRNRYQLRWQGIPSHLTVKLYAELGHALARWHNAEDGTVSGRNDMRNSGVANPPESHAASGHARTSRKA